MLEGRDLPPAEIEELRRESGEMAGRRAARACPRHHVKLQVTLDCLENFIVNDPSRAKSGEAEQSSNDGVPQAGRKSDHVPLRDSHGMPILPRGSLKGAVRSQAERILRTMALARGITDEAVILKRVACHPDDPGNSCPPIAELCEARECRWQQGCKSHYGGQYAQPDGRPEGGGALLRLNEQVDRVVH